METLLAYMLAFFIAHYYKYMAVSKFNTSRNSYIFARRVILFILFGAFFSVFFASEHLFKLLLNISPRKISAAPVFIPVLTAYAALIFVIDKNFRYSREQGYESNIFKYPLTIFALAFPFTVCFWLSKLTVIYLILVCFFGKNPQQQEENT